jgi:hypothetical protein
MNPHTCKALGNAPAFFGHYPTRKAAHETQMILLRYQTDCFGTCGELSVFHDRDEEKRKEKKSVELDYFGVAG